MNKLPLFFTLMISLFKIVCIGQTDNAFRTISGDQVLIKANDTVKGNPYLFSNWSMASIIDRDGNTLEDNQLNYDCIRETFLIKVADKHLALNKYKYVEVQVDTEDGLKNFINVAYDGDVFFAESLYRSENVALLIRHEAEKVITDRNSYSDVTSRYTIKKKDKYFIKIGKEVYPTLKKEKEVLKILAGHNLKPYIKKNKLKVRKDKDLIELVEYFDSLQ